MWIVTHTQKNMTEVLALFKEIEEARDYINKKTLGKQVEFYHDHDKKTVIWNLLNGSYYSLIG